MVVRTVDPKKRNFCLKEDDEQILNPNVPYLNVFGALLYLTPCTRLNILFTVKFNYEI